MSWRRVERQRPQKQQSRCKIAYTTTEKFLIRPSLSCQSTLTNPSRGLQLLVSWLISSYLDSVIHFAYVLLRMLEKYSKNKAYMYVRKKRVKRQKEKDGKSDE
jgi:hypothetical protein